MSEIAEAIRELSAEKGLDETSLRVTIQRMIESAYQKSFGKFYDNCIVKIADDFSEVKVYSRKTVVDGVYDSVIEIELEEARQFAPEAEIGDSIDIEIDPKKDFERSAVSVGKQEAHKDLNENSSKKLMDEYKEKIGQIIIGYYQRDDKKNNIFVDLGKVEGVLPSRYQSSRENYNQGDRIKALIKDVKKISSGIQVILSRTDENFVKSIIELEVPEIADGTIVIKSIAREASYRTKVAVYSNKLDVDPVGSCVGLKGVRITSVIRELEGEKIDVLRYDEDPHVFIKNALSPANVKGVYIKDMEKREAYAIVSEEEFSIAIGKQGQNVRLANRLCNWTIDVKTDQQVIEEGIDLTEDVSKKAEELFSNVAEPEELTAITQLPGVNLDVAGVIRDAGYDEIEKFVEAYDDGSIFNIEGIAKEEVEEVYEILSKYVEFEDEESAEEQAAEEAPAEAGEEEVYFCPECGERITLDMTRCPKCNVEFSFEEE